MLVQVEACGVGATVLNCINGDLANDPELLPRVPGHEFVGVIRDVGPGVDPTVVGRRIAAYFYLFCGRCGPCTTGLEQRCSRLAGFVGVHRDGGYAPLATLPVRNAVAIPDDLDPIAATVVPDAVATSLHLTHRAGIGTGDRVVIMGAGGGVGMHAIQTTLNAGAAVVGIDMTTEKLDAISDLGAAAARGEDLTGLSPELFGGERATVVVDFVGTPETVDWSLDALGMGGRFVTLTTFRDRSATFRSRRMVFQELALLGSRYTTRTELEHAARMVSSGAVKPVIGATKRLEDVLELHAMLRANELVGRGALEL
ncbi:MAG: alcohol dehydrogenase catalytic domain-containing protein [Acidimicrobiia bacterium]|nr:alcohol dehydrogenase catalytic domain-containing protein [Acidimicrobiia bacterium]